MRLRDTTCHYQFRHRSTAALLVLFTLLVRPGAADQDFVRGDDDASGVIDLSDAIGLLACLFTGGACPTCDDAADADDNGALDISDPVRILGYLYLGGEAPPPPNTCGPDPTADALSCDEYLRCEAVDPVKFFWPLPGTDGNEWVVTRYVDLDGGPGLRDYTGATAANARTTDQNKGIDIDVPNFRAMDADFPVLAAADGVVSGIRDGNFDRNTSSEQGCFSLANDVSIEHADGTTTFYSRLKKDSIVVKVGDAVGAGEKIGVVGSSGCSTQPHLHFEVYNRSGKFIDPFKEQMWVHPPAYQSPLSIMDVALKDGGFQDIEEVKDPPGSNLDTISPENTLGIGLSIAGGLPAESIQVELKSPAGLPMPLGVIVPDRVQRHSFHRFNRELRQTGEWTLTVRVNGVVRHESRFGVHHPLGYQAFGLELTESRLKESLKDAELRPVAVDGYSFGNAALYNVVWERAPGVKWTLLYDIPGSIVRALIDTQSQMGRRVADLDSYRVGNEVRYLALMTDEPGPEQELLLGIPEPAQLSMLNQLKSQGFRPVDMSVVDLGPIKVFTTLCEKSAAGDLVHLHGMTTSEYQSAFQQQTARGLRLLHLDVHNDSGNTPRFAAIWDSRPTGGWAARHDMDSAKLAENLIEFTFRQHLKTRFITGYVRNGQSSFGAFWSQR